MDTGAHSSGSPAHRCPRSWYRVGLSAAAAFGGGDRLCGVGEAAEGFFGDGGAISFEEAEEVSALSAGGWVVAAFGGAASAGGVVEELSSAGCGGSHLPVSSGLVR